MVPDVLSYLLFLRDTVLRRKQLFRCLWVLRFLLIADFEVSIDADGRSSVQ